MPSPVNLTVLGVQSVNTSGNYALTLGALSAVLVDRDPFTPANDPVSVEFSTVSILGLGTIIVREAQLKIDGLGVNIGATYVVGQNGVLEFAPSGAVISALTTVNFDGDGGELVFDPGVDSSVVANVTGFHASNVLDFRGITGVDHLNYDNGTLRLLDAAGFQLAAVVLQDNPDLTGLGFQSDGHGGTGVGVGLGLAGTNPSGFPVDFNHTQFLIVKNDAGLGYVQDKIAGRSTSFVLPQSNQFTLTGKFDLPVFNGTSTANNTVIFSDGIGRYDPTGNAELVAHIYRAAYGRSIDGTTLDVLTANLQGNATTASQIAQTFTQSAEFQAKYGALDSTSYVQKLYTDVLGRPGDAVGVAGWTAQLDAGESRSDLLLDFSSSFENAYRNLDTMGDQNYGIDYRLYQAAVGATPDITGLFTYYYYLKDGHTGQDMSAQILQSAPAQAIYGGLSNTDFVNQLYDSVLHRTADAPGLNGWVGALNQGAARSDILLAFSESFENRLATAGATHDNWVFLGGKS